MLASFVLTMAIAAPVPAPTAPVASGPAPRLLELKANADGKITVTVTRTEMVKVPVAQGNAINPGGAAPAVVTREVAVKKTMIVELGDVKDLKITTADGKKVETADAMKQLKAGATVVVSTDGKPVSPNFLKLFKDDVLVLSSPELVGGPVNNGPSTGPRPRPGGGGGIRPVPLPVAPAVVPAPGVIQIQIQPGQIQVIPLQPALPAPVPAPEK
jgi:hypothetical protein